MAICETCDYANRPPYKSPCSECDKTTGSPFCCYEHEEKPTNADRIRAMSDEELAEFLCDRTENCNLGYCPGADLCNCVDGKANGYLKWLKQPAEGGGMRDG